MTDLGGGGGGIDRGVKFMSVNVKITMKKSAPNSRKR